MKLLQAAKNALADLEGIMPDFEPSGNREHPAWKTIEELKEATKYRVGDTKQKNKDNLKKKITRYALEYFKNDLTDDDCEELGSHSIVVTQVIKELLEEVSA